MARMGRRGFLRMAGLGALALGAAACTGQKAHGGETVGRREGAMRHVALLGDSILANEAYVPAGQAVIDHLQRAAPAGWRGTLRARDGATTAGVPSQLEGLPDDVTHLVVSVGGNDALRYSGILGEGTRSVGEALLKLADMGEAFQRAYHAMLTTVLSRRLPTAVCTIYYPHYPDPTQQRASVAGSTLFNDVILREAFAAGLPVIDLRQVMTAGEDYANAIEPSSAGGQKIARAVLGLVGQHDFQRGRSEVFVAG